MKNLACIFILIVSIPLYSQVTPTYNHPGVYVEEIPSPSMIVSVSTSITAFIGNTEKNTSKTNAPILITSLAEFEQKFGGAPSPQFNVLSYANPSNIELEFVSNTRYFMYHSVRLFFKNGGEMCYVTSTGNYKSGVQKKALLNGIEQLKNVIDVNQIVIPDAMLLPRNQRAAVQNQMLIHAKANNRFAILDVFEEMDITQSVDNFRTDIQGDDLKYGAAYYPWLKTPISNSIHPKDYIVGWEDLVIEDDSDWYKSIKKALTKQLSIIPPSGAIAGVYVETDNTAGVWKAPANVSIAGITGFTSSISNIQQQAIYVSVSDGKSINPLRTFPSKGNVIWGARTLAGNDNEWRYISVRRLTSMIEESIEFYLQSLVFESNNQSTWTNAQIHIEDYLKELWQSGALMGSNSKQAYNVQVGLGKTMTQKDLDEGKMKIQINIAVDYPAEFMVLAFEAKLVN